MEHSHRAPMVITVLVGIIMLITLAFSGLGEKLLKTTSETVAPIELGSQTYTVQSVEFKGEQTFWTDSRDVVINTEEGAFVYPKGKVTYVQTDDDIDKVVVTEYDRIQDRAVLYVGSDKIKTLRTDYAGQFGENIIFNDDIATSVKE